MTEFELKTLVNEVLEVVKGYLDVHKGVLKDMGNDIEEVFRDSFERNGVEVVD